MGAVPLPYTDADAAAERPAYQCPQWLLQKEASTLRLRSAPTR
jgi:hypothetical protein